MSKKIQFIVGLAWLLLFLLSSCGQSGSVAVGPGGSSGSSIPDVSADCGGQSCM